MLGKDQIPVWGEGNLSQLNAHKKTKEEPLSSARQVGRRWGGGEGMAETGGEEGGILKGQNSKPKKEEALTSGWPPIAIDPVLFSNLLDGGATPIPASSFRFISPTRLYSAHKPPPPAPPPSHSAQTLLILKAMRNNDHNHGLNFFPFSTDRQLCRPLRITWPARDNHHFGQSGHQANWKQWKLLYEFL